MLRSWGWLCVISLPAWAVLVAGCGGGADDADPVSHDAGRYTLDGGADALDDANAISHDAGRYTFDGGADAALSQSDSEYDASDDALAYDATPQTSDDGGVSAYDAMPGDGAPLDCLSRVHPETPSSLFGSCSSSFGDCVREAENDDALEQCYASVSEECEACVQNEAYVCVTQKGGCGDSYSETLCCLDRECPASDSGSSPEDQSACTSAALDGACASELNRFLDCAADALDTETCPYPSAGCISTISLVVGGTTVDECQGQTGVATTLDDAVATRSGIAVWSQGNLWILGYTRAYIDDYARGGKPSEYRVSLLVPNATHPGNYQGLLAIAQWNGSSWTQLATPSEVTIVEIAEFEAIRPDGAMMCSGEVAGRADTQFSPNDYAVFAFDVPLLTTEFPSTAAGPP